MSRLVQGQAGYGYRKRRVRRRLCELVGSYAHSRPALNELDIKLESYLINGEITEGRGFFIEAGANDGFEQSNTYYLARKYNWSGLLIEPLPDLADHCQKIRKESTLVRCALGPREAEGTTVTIHRAGRMSTVEGALGDSSRQHEHLERAGKLQSGAVPGDISVPVRSLSSIIEEHAPDQRIDLLSLDVEGFEPQALAGLDLDRHAPRFICVEANNQPAIEAIIADRNELSYHDRFYKAKPAGVIG